MSAAPEPTRLEVLADRLAAVRRRLAAACQLVGRAPSELTLIAVSKTWPAADIALLAQLGLRDFGENRDQEAAAKAAELAALHVTWHFVGRLQSNKCRSVASYAKVVHSLDRPKLVSALSTGAQAAGRNLDVLIQVSLDDDPGRGGAAAESVPALGDVIATAPGLRLRGVMAVAPLGVEPAAAFDRLAAVASRLRATHQQAGWISAGMTGDLEPAVAAGATHVRIGTALFGGRTPLDRSLDR